MSSPSSQVISPKTFLPAITNTIIYSSRGLIIFSEKGTSGISFFFRNFLTYVYRSGQVFVSVLFGPTSCSAQGFHLALNLGVSLCGVRGTYEIQRIKPHWLCARQTVLSLRLHWSPSLKSQW